MANETTALSQLSKHVSAIGGVATSFKQAAGEQNKSIFKIVKDISNVFAANKSSMADIATNIMSQSQQIQQSSVKIDNTNNILQQTLTTQSSMLAELKKISIAIKSDDKNDKGSSSSGWLDLLKNQVTNHYRIL